MGPELRREAEAEAEAEAAAWDTRSSEWMNEVTVSYSAEVAQAGDHPGQTGVCLSRLGPLFIH